MTLDDAITAVLGSDIAIIGMWIVAGFFAYCMFLVLLDFFR